MEARNISVVSKVEAFQEGGISAALAIAKRVVALSPVVKHLRECMVGDDSVRAEATSGGGLGSYSRSGVGVEFPSHSLHQAVRELERLRKTCGSTLVSGDLRYVMMIQASLEAYLSNELDRCCSMGAAAGYQDIHSLQPVILLKGLLDIYCDALAHPSEEWEGEGSRSVACDMAVRAVEAARLLAMFSWVRSEEVLPVVWRVLSSVHKLLEGHGGGLAQIFPGRTKASSSEDVARMTIARILLLSLADPFSLQSSEIVAADYLIAYHLTREMLGDAWSSGAVAFDLVLGLPFSGREGPDGQPSGCVVWLAVNEIAAKVLEQVATREQGISTPLQQLGMLNLPRMLAKRWMSYPSRRQVFRTEVHIGSRLICGAQSLIQAEKPSIRSGDDKHTRYAGRNCVVLDYSDTGCRVRLPSANYLNLFPGVLVGIELPSTQGRSLGVISWVRRSTEPHVEIGIRILAREIEPVPFKLLSGRWEGGSSVEFGLIAVGESGGLDRSSVEISLPLSKVPADKLEILRAVNTSTDFHVQEVLEVGQDFLRIRAGTQPAEAYPEVEFAPFSI